MNFLVIAGSGIGGTEKAAFLFAEALLKKGHHVVAISKPSQPRTVAFEAAGGIIMDLGDSQQSLENLLLSHQFDIIHQHVSGYGDHRQLYAALDKLGDKRPRLIETNVFGYLLDFYDHGHVDMRMFISFTSGMQAFTRTRIKKVRPDPKCHTVLFYPTHPDEFDRYPLNDSSYRESIGVGKNEFLVIRLGRPGHKWTRWECMAFRLARRQNPQLRMLLIEPSLEITAAIDAKEYGEGIIVQKTTSDPEILAQIYGAADVMIHASNFGESFGYTLAEAMVAALPIVTLSTPWGDNAQTELIKHGKTGFVCCSVRGMANALLEFSLSPDLCHKMGSAGREHINSFTSLENETDLLIKISEYVLTGIKAEKIKHRFSSWIEFVNSRSNNFIFGGYEFERGMWLSFFRGKLYAAYRMTKTLNRYLILKKRGKPVALPNISKKVFRGLNQ